MGQDGSLEKESKLITPDMHDILIHIFECCLKNDIDQHSKASQNNEAEDKKDTPEWNAKLGWAPYSPMWMSQVCRFWRRIALSQSSLWSNFVIDATVPPAKNGNLSERLRLTSKIHAALDIWLPRSGIAPLDVSVAIPFSSRHSKGEEELYASSLRLYQRIVLCSTRWRNVTLKRSATSWVEFSESKTLLLDLPHLENLDWRLDTASFCEERVLDLSMSPRLKSLEVHGRCTFEFGEQTFNSLASVRYSPVIGGVLTRAFFRTIFNTSSLEFLELVLNSSRNVTISVDKVKLGRLLSVTNNGPYITLPNLKQISLRCFCSTLR